MPLPEGLTARDAMAIGTAGFTAAMSRRGARGPRACARGTARCSSPARAAASGAARSRSSPARGHEVWAATGKADEEARLAVAGRGRVRAARGGHRREPAATRVGALGRGRRRGRWGDAAVRAADAPPGRRRRVVRQRGRPALSTTVLPFILRGVALLGMDSSAVPIEARRALWARLGSDLRPNGLGEGVTEVTLDTLEPALDGILAGVARGRWVVRVGG